MKTQASGTQAYPSNYSSGNELTVHFLARLDWKTNGSHELVTFSKLLIEDKLSLVHP